MTDEERAIALLDTLRLLGTIRSYDGRDVLKVEEHLRRVRAEQREADARRCDSYSEAAKLAADRVAAYDSIRQYKIAKAIAADDLAREIRATKGAAHG